MGVRPLNGLVSIAECDSRFEADAAVARLAASGITAVVVGDPAASVAPHLATEAGFSVLVPIAIADDAQQALVRGRGPDGGGPSSLVHPTLRPRQPRPDGPPPIGSRPAPSPVRRTGEAADDDPGDLDDDEERSSPARPRWMKVMAWVMAASVLGPLLLGVVRTIALL